MDERDPPVQQGPQLIGMLGRSVGGCQQDRVGCDSKRDDLVLPRISAGSIAAACASTPILSRSTSPVRRPSARTRRPRGARACTAPTPRNVAEAPTGAGLFLKDFLDIVPAERNHLAQELTDPTSGVASRDPLPARADSMTPEIRGAPASATSHQQNYDVLTAQQMRVAKGDMCV